MVLPRGSWVSSSAAGRSNVCSRRSSRVTVWIEQQHLSFAGNAVGIDQDFVAAGQRAAKRVPEEAEIDQGRLKRQCFIAASLVVVVRRSRRLAAQYRLGRGGQERPLLRQRQ